MTPFKKNKKQLSIFITAGYPALNSLNEQLLFLQDSGIDFIEVGIPFSDPLADGPVIQATSTIALKNGMNLALLFDQLSKRTSTIPLVLMGYLNPVLAFGIEKFLERCVDCGVKTVILPDLSLEIYQRNYQSHFEKFGVSPAFIVTPSSSDDRIELAAELCKASFVYVVSSNTTTGSTTNALSENAVRYNEIKQLCGVTPVFIGFGIKTKEDVLSAQSSADGAIIGSAYLKALSHEEQTIFLKSIRS